MVGYTEAFGARSLLTAPPPWSGSRDPKQESALERSVPGICLGCSLPASSHPSPGPLAQIFQPVLTASLSELLDLGVLACGDSLLTSSAFPWLSQMWEGNYTYYLHPYFLTVGEEGGECRL